MTNTTDTRRLTLRYDEATIARLAEAAETVGQSKQAWIEGAIQARLDLTAKGQIELEQFSKTEMNLIRDACKGIGMIAEHGNGGPLRAAWQMALEVEDACRSNALHTKYGVSDLKNLVLRIRLLTPGGQFAILEDVMRFWAVGGAVTVPNSRA